MVTVRIRWAEFKGSVAAPCAYGDKDPVAAVSAAVKGARRAVIESGATLGLGGSRGPAAGRSAKGVPVLTDREHDGTGPDRARPEATQGVAQGVAQGARRLRVRSGRGRRVRS
ncbi:hypothetical protein GCM10022419_100500 [Nonomuraea rosea]|uniref:Uncharacterized protein n=1 Tax=Nonomuraea rosea TaxID=638574 RepID=A0ABP6Z8V3_9ACTN